MGSLHGSAGTWTTAVTRWPEGWRAAARSGQPGVQGAVGGGTAAGTMGVPSLGCSAERVSLALRLVRVNVEGEEA